MTTPLPLIPQPAWWERRPGTFIVPSQPQDFVQTIIDPARAPQLGDEGYELTVSADTVRLVAASARGAYYGRETVRQLPSPAGAIPCVQIVDRPRFAWRGMLLDISRHFFPVEHLKRGVDLLALHKLNILHLHLTDDQGWRLAIEKYPPLTAVGSLRRETPLPHDPERGDGQLYGGFYTANQIRELVAYAAARQITVVPEIEMPGHSLAALAAYPALSCTGGPFAVRTKWGVEPDVYCAGNDQVFAFLETVLTEVLALFPSKYIHIGGDECPTDRWQACPKCQARRQAEGLKDEHELQSYFIRRIEKFLNQQGRQLVGWDEILQGGLAPGATVMSWRGTEGGLAAAAAGHDAIMTPHTECYFNYLESRAASEPPGPTYYKDALSLGRVYAYEPIPAALPADKHHHIIGAQACLWTEYVPTWELVEYLTLPRLCALAEVAWSPAANRDYASFRRRLPPHLQRLDQLGFNHRKLDPVLCGS